MSAALPLDLDDLAAPISEEQPAGVDLRLDSSFTNPLSHVKDLRDEARRIERRAQEGAEDETGQVVQVIHALPKWQKVVDQGREVLIEKSKDLEIAACMVEGWVRLSGFSGLRIGLTLIKRLVETYWDTLYPLPDEDGMETRVRPIDRLNSTLPEALMRVAVTQGRGEGPFASWQHRQAHELVRLTPEDREERINRGATTLDQFNRAVAETDPGFFQDLLTDLHCCREEVLALEEALQPLCSVSDLPSTSALLESLEGIEQTVRTISAGRLPAAAGVEGTVDPATGAVITSGAKMASGPIRTRDDAFRALNDVASFFEQMDPQSLLAAQIRRVIHLGQLSPAEYFVEVLEDDAAREKLFKLVGITPTVKPTE